MARKKLSKQSEFKPDPRQWSLSQLFHLTQLQKQRILKWTLYVLTGILLLTIQDVIMGRVSIFGATADLPAVYILLITVIEGVDVGSLFVLFASTIYYFSGSAPGPYCVGLLCAVGIVATLLRQAYLRRTKASIVICAGIALTIYEMGLFIVVQPIVDISPAVKIRSFPAVFPINSGGQGKGQAQGQEQG